MSAHQTTFRVIDCDQPSCSEQIEGEPNEEWVSLLTRARAAKWQAHLRPNRQIYCPTHRKKVKKP